MFEILQVAALNIELSQPLKLRKETLGMPCQGVRGQMLVEQEQQLHRVVVKVDRVLDTDDEGGEPALTPHCHAVRLAHVQAAEDPLFKSQDLVHIVEELNAELIELTGVVVANLNQRLLVNCQVSRKVRSPLMEVKLDNK